jgi:sphingolipid 8-(E)-desaturase
MDTLKRMRRHQIGIINETWVDITPPISEVNGEFSTRNDLSVESLDVVTGSHPTTSAEWLKSRSLTDQIQSKQQSSLIDSHHLEVKLDQSKYPSLDVKTQRAISDSFQALHETIRRHGLYQCKFSSYTKEISRYLLLFVTFCALFKAGWIVSSAVFLGLFWHQIMFSAHDAGHLSMTQNFVVDTSIGIFIADFCCGLSLGWWKSSHNVHHIVPNHPVSQPHRN